MRDKKTAADDLRKLIVDYKIIVESYKFGVVGKTFNACITNWGDFCRFNLKIPSDVIGEYFPKLKDFFAILKEIVLRNEIPQSKREKFLKFISEDAELIDRAIADAVNVLVDKYSYQLNGLNEDDIQKVVSFLPNNTFADYQGNFHKILSDKANELRKGQLKNQLLNLWYKVAGSKLPREWSKINRTPILAMVPKSEIPTAQKVFETIMSSAPNEKDVRFAIDYLEKRPSFLDAMKDELQIETAFRKIFLGKYVGLLNDNDEVRNELETKFQTDPYNWYPNVGVNELVKNIAENKYYSGGAYDKVTEKVMRMPDEDAKKILIELLDKNFEVGLKILREY